jgi:hypothetical protein
VTIPHQFTLCLPAPSVDLAEAERLLAAARLNGRASLVSDLEAVVADANAESDPLERARLITRARVIRRELSKGGAA